MHCKVPVARAVKYRDYNVCMYNKPSVLCCMESSPGNYRDKSRPKVPKVTELQLSKGCVQSQLCPAVISGRYQQALRLHDALLWHSLQYYAQFQSSSFKNRGSGKISDWVFLNLLKLRPRSSRFLFTSLEVTNQKKKLFRRKITIQRK